MDPILAANLRSYADGTQVAEYLATAYHARRVADAVDLLTRETRRRAARPLIVDLGAGGRAVSEELRRRGAHTVMVDMDAHLPGQAASWQIPMVRADLSRPLPLRSASVDGVFAGEIIEHLFDPVAFLRECWRVLAPGGALVVTTPNLATLQDRVRFLFGRNPRQIDPHHPYLKLHIRPFTYSSLARTFHVCGFRLTGFRSNYVVVGGDERSMSVRFLARLFPSIGGSLVLAGVKAADGAGVRRPGRCALSPGSGTG
ncbi:bifunctional 2-polyprenyl-6-hydroxyphenol methylase/3-demethylubiquinol 3-O-methyltransferase UbiG [Frankia sp. Cj3]|uniref:class I SAM-dependent methyltransferase n=1 Tax=Frankia sp. Cj3 TaxID=2880976 RepID=UPI001EF3FED3|nr:class I SAM-dependent methyltransferase [Frankia sp. Cj3]